MTLTVGTFRNFRMNFRLICIDMMLLKIIAFTNFYIFIEKKSYIILNIQFDRHQF